MSKKIEAAYAFESINLSNPSSSAGLRDGFGVGLRRREISKAIAALPIQDHFTGFEETFPLCSPMGSDSEFAQ